jgi:hypothetical protein
MIKEAKYAATESKEIEFNWGVTFKKMTFLA